MKETEKIIRGLGDKIAFINLLTTCGLNQSVLDFAAKKTNAKTHKEFITQCILQQEFFKAWMWAEKFLTRPQKLEWVGFSLSCAFIGLSMFEFSAANSHLTVCEKILKWNQSNAAERSMENLLCGVLWSPLKKDPTFLLLSLNKIIDMLDEKE